MSQPLKILCLGASYGSLLATKLALAGHETRLICLPAEVERINADGVRVRMPVKGRDGLVEVHSKRLPGRITASGPADVDPGDFDLVCLAMQEPQYRAAGVRELLDRVARSRVPCMSIMNMPPLPFLARIPGLPMKALAGCYTDASVWASFDPATITLCSPDPQAFRPPEEPVNVLQVTLPTNFKAARFESDKDTAVLERLQDDIEKARLELDGARVELPVKLKVHGSIYVPLAKWAMLLTGNYRCVQREGMRAIKDAVHSDPAASRSMYSWVNELCVAIGADARDMVPFEKYARAAEGLLKPSSAARALAAGAPNIERVDRIVQTIAAERGLRNAVLDETVATVDAWVAANREKAKPA